MYQVDATARAPEGLTLNNPAQARKGAVWGHATRDPACVPKARALNPSVFEEFKSASLRDAVAHVLTYPTLRFKRGCSLWSRTRTIVGLLPSVATHACAGLLRVSASGTVGFHHLVLSTLRFERGCSHWPLLHAYAGLLRVSASGTGYRHRTYPCRSAPAPGRTKLHLLRA